MNTLEDWAAAARANLERDGELAPVLHVEYDGQPVLIAIQGMPGDAEERAALMRRVGRRMARLRPTRATMVTDAYMSRAPYRGSLADDPEAVECIVVASLTSEGDSQVLTVQYEREPRLEGTAFTFGPPERHGDGAEMFLLRAFFEGVGTG